MDFTPVYYHSIMKWSLGRPAGVGACFAEEGARGCAVPAGAVFFIFLGDPFASRRDGYDVHSFCCLRAPGNKQAKSHVVETVDAHNSACDNWK